jgi:FAD synthase
MSDSIKKYFETERDYSDWMEQRWTKTSTIETKSRDGIVQDVKDLYEQRSQVGIKKYNTTLEDSKESLEAFLIHLQEELMDATLYIEKLKQLNNGR